MISLSFLISTSFRVEKQDAVFQVQLRLLFLFQNNGQDRA